MNNITINNIKKIINLLDTSDIISYNIEVKIQSEYITYENFNDIYNLHELEELNIIFKGVFMNFKDVCINGDINFKDSELSYYISDTDINSCRIVEEDFNKVYKIVIPIFIDANIIASNNTYNIDDESYKIYENLLKSIKSKNYPRKYKIDYLTE